MESHSIPTASDTASDNDINSQSIFPISDHEYMYISEDAVDVGSTVEVSSFIEFSGCASFEAEAVDIDIDLGQTLQKSRHHRGPVSEDYITDKTKRQKSFSKRLQTFKAEARRLHTMCGAKVSLVVEAESGRMTKMSFPTKSYRTVKSQAGNSTTTPAKTTRKTTPTNGSPKKSP